MYPATTLFVALGQFAIVVLVLFSYPLQVHPCRACLDKVFDPKDSSAAQKAVAAHDDAEDDVDEQSDPDHASSDMSAFKHTVLTSCIVAFGFLIAYHVDDLRLGTLLGKIMAGCR